jgi:hypothetical protein
MLLFFLSNEIAFFYSGFLVPVQARKEKSLDREQAGQLDELEKAIEGKQFVAHANSILETEEVVEKVKNS